MIEKAPVSLCLIVKNDLFIENCLKAVRDYVAEIVVIDTGSTDNTPEIAKKYADKFEVYTKCNNPETGLIEDFSDARQYSFSLATQKWVMWCDSDDIIDGIDKLQLVINEMEKKFPNAPAIQVAFPYEYAYNELGQCICEHYRERLMLNKNCFYWRNPVHEVIIPNEGIPPLFDVREEIRFKHHRQFTNKKPEAGRNLRILKKYLEKVGDTDPRQLYYIGLEYCNAGQIDEAIKHLTKYIDLSGWDDERCMACLKLVDIYAGLQNWDEGLKWAFKGIEIKHTWGENYFAAAKMFYHKAMKGGHNEYDNWDRCIHFSQTGLKCTPTKTLLFVNPLEREYEIHKYLNFAFNKLGRVKEALESINTGLKSRPNEMMFLGNKKLYEDFLARNEIVVNSNILKSNNSIDQSAYDNIISLINNQSLQLNKDNWNIPETYDFDEYPLDINEKQLHSVVMMLWKQYMLHDDAENAIKFLENPPTALHQSGEINKAIDITKQFLINKDKIEITAANPLDIIFFIGNGIEEWTPKTVDKTGIGGSELMAIELSKRLAAFGHKVRVYNNCGKNGSGYYNKVKYEQTEKYHDLECDILIVSRRADVLSDNFNIKAKLKLLWVHDIFALNATNELLLKADRILALSDWHKNNLVETHHIHPNHIIKTRNGINLARFDKQIKRNQYKCVNSSSPDRSWPVLLEMWPEIKKQVPEAELHLYYGFKNWKYTAQFQPGHKDLIIKLEQQIKDLENKNVVFHDRVNQEELATELLSAGACLYPTWFSETFFIGGAEMQAAGVRVISSSIAAINETVGTRGTLIAGDWTSSEYKAQFIDATAKVLTNTDNSDREQLQQYAKENFDLDSLAKQWENMFYELIENKKTNPIVPYYPTTSYR